MSRVKEFNVQAFRHLWEKSGYSLGSIALFSGVDRTLPTKWLKGISAPQEETVKILAKLFKVKANELYVPHEPRPIYCKKPISADRLRALIYTKHGSIYKFAASYGVHPSTAYKWLSGRFNPRNDDRLYMAEHFGVSVAYLEGEADE